MLTPVSVSVEALYSATYVENYLDCVENLPDDLQRLLSRMRELDVRYRAYLRDVEQQTEWLSTRDAENSNRKAKTLSRIQQALIAAQELGDEKLNVVQNLLDLIENKTRQLDLDYKNLDYGKDEPTPETKEPQPAPVTTSTNPPVLTSSGERQSKRARRTRHDTLTNIETNATPQTSTTEHVLRSAVTSSTAATTTTTNTTTTTTTTTTTSNTSQKKTTTGTGKKKKRKQRVHVQPREESPPHDEEPAIDPDEPTYCLCDQISFGEMIMCDNDLCPIEWFHFSCVSLTTKPKGKWFCPMCRSDRPNVMKPKAQFLRELERYNKEKEEKT